MTYMPRCNLLFHSALQEVHNGYLAAKRKYQVG